VSDRRGSARDRLRDGEATIAELTEALGASHQKVSQHLAVLAICEQVCGGVQRQLAELQQIFGGAGR
jgi:DNA-binding transcriptional ArsR family regulator